MNKIKLDDYETEWAMSVGFYRHNESEKRNKPQSDGSKDINALPNHQRGAAAEIAATKYLEIPWNASVNTYNHFPDLGGALEVRSKTKGQKYIRLKTRADAEKGHVIFVSVTRLGKQEFEIDGWILGREGMTSKYLVASDQRSKKPEWHVPLNELHSPETLKAEVEKQSKIYEAARENFQRELKGKLIPAGTGIDKPS